MIVDEQLAIDHGLKKKNTKKFAIFLKEIQILLSLVFFQQCGMSTALTNHPNFI